VQDHGRRGSSKGQGGELVLKRILVTGVGGFTGPYLRARLRADGARVIGLLRPGEPGESGDIACDITDAAALKAVVAEIKPDQVVHLAGITFVPHADTEAIWRVNVDGTRNLLEACLALTQHPAKFVLASSANVYGNAPISPVSEQAPLAPESDYACSKLEVERLAIAWRDRLPLLVVRPFNYTGVGQEKKFVIPKIVAAFRQGDDEINLGRTDVVRDFSDVRWVVDAYARLLASPLHSDVFNLCSGVGCTLTSVIETLGRLSGHMPKIIQRAEFMRAGEIERLIGSADKLQAAIGPLPPIALDQTLAWMLNAAPADHSSGLQ